jgi:hypothetical protein
MEISMILKSILAAAATAALAAPVAAQTSSGADAKAQSEVKAGAPAAGGSRSDAFGELDRNKDGHLSREESKDTPWANRFSEIDRDNDERISQSEYEANEAAAGASAARNPR